MAIKRFSLTPRALFVGLLVPTVLIGITSCGLIPWLIATRERLDNSYWEMQLLLAAIALGSVCLALPGLAIRSFGWLERLSTAVWLVTAFAYGIVLIFILQSHFPIVTKLVVAGFNVFFIVLCGVGLRIEHLMKTSANQSSGSATRT